MRKSDFKAPQAGRLVTGAHGHLLVARWVRREAVLSSMLKIVD
jgi:hypothetical protein